MIFERPKDPSGPPGILPVTYSLSPAPGIFHNTPMETVSLTTSLYQCGLVA